MKIKKFIFLIIFILLFIACSENKENDLSKEGLNGQVKSIQEMTFICSDKYGEIIKERVRELRDYKEFNKSGNLTKYISLSLSVFDMTDTIFYLYNEKKIVKERITKGYVNTKIIYEYNELNNVLQIKTYDAAVNGELTSLAVYEYDDYGNVTEIITQFYHCIGLSSLEEKFEYQYDNKNNITECKETRCLIGSIDSSNSNYTKIKKYDNNNLITEVKLKSNGKVSEEHLYDYNKGRLIKEEHKYIQPLYEHLSTKMYQYDSKGNLTLVHEISSQENHLSERYINYEYDHHDNWIKQIYRSSANVYTLEREINYYGEPEKKEFKDIIQDFKRQKVLEKYCDAGAVRERVLYYMNLHYPDWDICTDIKITDISNCKFNVQFQVVNPHLLPYAIKKEQVIAEFSYSEDFSLFYFDIIRGTLY